MTQIHTREQLMTWLGKEAERCGRRYLVRAMGDPLGKVESLGGFSPIPPSNTSGWIVRITSRNKQVWILGVLAHKDRYGVLALQTVPWYCYVGGQTELYRGDYGGKPKETEL